MNRSETFDYLRTRKGIIIAERKAMVKRADPVEAALMTLKEGGNVTKAESNPELLNLSEFYAKLVINTTNLMDSHDDVHIPGLWKKTIHETKLVYLLQEHVMKFDHIISDRVQMSAKMMPWRELGFPFAGMTEALIFDAIIDKERNAYMAEQYAKGRVNNHSVAMRYITVKLAMESDDLRDREEREVWDQYISQIVNRKDAEDKGYFFAVTEARVIEGSAVPRGSNWATPTLSTTSVKAAEQVEAVTPPAAQFDTSKLLELIQTLKSN